LQAYAYDAVYAIAAAVHAIVEVRKRIVLMPTELMDALLGEAS
jgi:hypothetical protein